MVQEITESFEDQDYLTWHNWAYLNHNEHHECHCENCEKYREDLRQQ